MSDYKERQKAKKQREKEEREEQKLAAACNKVRNILAEADAPKPKNWIEAQKGEVSQSDMRRACSLMIENNELQPAEYKDTQRRKQVGYQLKKEDAR